MFLFWLFFYCCRCCCGCCCSCCFCYIYLNYPVFLQKKRKKKIWIENAKKKNSLEKWAHYTWDKAIRFSLSHCPLYFQPLTEMTWLGLAWLAFVSTNIIFFRFFPFFFSLYSFSSSQSLFLLFLVYFSFFVFYFCVFFGCKEIEILFIIRL